jgi:hypothetical protein
MCHSLPPFVCVLEYRFHIELFQFCFSNIPEICFILYSYPLYYYLRLVSLVCGWKLQNTVITIGNRSKHSIIGMTKQASLAILEGTTMLLQVKVWGSFLFSFVLRLLLETCVSFSQTAAKIIFLITLIFTCLHIHKGRPADATQTERVYNVKVKGKAYLHK